MSWEGVFSFIWMLIQCVFWLCALAGALIVGVAILIGCWRAARNLFPARGGGMSLEDYDREANAIALDMFKNDQMPKNTMDAFRAGSRWGWGALHRKK